ncbi:MAG: hypothetical protein QM679_12315 [Patulibacter sp.]
MKLRDRLDGLGAGAATPNERFALRIAHSMTEAWLLADHEGFARYFRVRPGKLPALPEQLPHAKRFLLDLCRHSTSRAIRAEVVTSRGETGPLYVRHLNDFAANHWDVDAAATRSPSLDRAVRAIARMPK